MFARVIVLLVLALPGLPAMADPERDAATHYRQGVAYEKAGAFDRAADEYKQAHAHDNRPDHLFNIGRVFEQKGDLRQAIEFYEKFLAAAPNHPNAKDARQALAVATKKLADAEATAAAERTRIEEDRERARVAAEAHLKQAAELERRGAWSAAAEEYVRATTADGDPEHLLLAAEAYRKQPELTKARATLQQYLDKVPNGPRSDEVRTKVADLARQIQESEAKATADANAALEAKHPRPRGPKARKRALGWKIGVAGLGVGAVSGVFAYLGHRVTAGIEEGTIRNANQIPGAFSRGTTYNRLAYGTAVLGVIGIAIGGVTIGINRGDEVTSIQVKASR